MMEIMPENVIAEREAKARRKSTLSNTSEGLLIGLARIKKELLLKSNKNVSRFTISEDYQVMTVSSMLPDEVINNAYDYEQRKLDAVVMFADVSGFTDLSDKYQSLENGASKLSMVLNFYIGSMVLEILSQGGDIIKYAGDAFLAIFRAENELNMQEAVHKALNSSLVIQKNCSNFSTDFESVTLNVKIAISCGEVHFSLLGDDISSHYVIVGDPVWEVKSLQDDIKPGETLMSKKVWPYVQEQLYKHKYIKSAGHYKIYGFKDCLEIAKRQHLAFLDFNHEMQLKFVKDKTDQSSLSELLTQETSFDRQNNEPLGSGEGNYSLRKSKLTMDAKSKRFLSRFIIRPVLNAIDLNEPIEQLTEMRHVVIVFANFVVLKTSDRDLIDIVDKIYVKLNSLVTDHEGILNKVSLFDKDMMFLIIFGLRGFKHELESRVALRCASELHETFKSWPEVSTVSLGVTTGMSYCGVVGHTLRREYSVISFTVNKAARLMMAYPSIVSCDHETLLYSKMEWKHFRILPKKKMKGLRYEIDAYEFKEIAEDIEVLPPFNFKFPILGRNEVIEMSQKLLKAAISNSNQEADNKKPNFHKISCLVIKDDKHQGKTRVLEEIHSNVYHTKLQCLRLKLSHKYLKFPYFMISKVMRKALNIENISNGKSAEEIIAEKFDGFNLEEYFCLLNPILDVNFVSSETVASLDEENKILVEKTMFKILCTQTFQDFFTLLVDDFEHVDEPSLDLMECLFESYAIFTVITLGHQRKLNDGQKKILEGSAVVQYRLGKIAVSYQNEIACRLLNVSALSLALEEYLHKFSEGNPGWIENTSKALLQSNKIEIRSMTMKEALKRGIVINEVPEFKDDDLMRSEARIIQVAMLKSHSILNEYLSIARADRDLMTYDSLSSYEQLVCKCAAVIGVEFTRHMLSYIMSHSTDRMIGKAVVKLFEMQIFKCTSAYQEEEDPEFEKESQQVVCKCQNLKIFNSCRDLPYYSCCASIKFHRDGFRSVVYDSLTDKQRIEYHRRSLLYLHMETRRCDSCENEPFDELLLQEFDFKFHDGVLDEDDNSYELMVEHFDSLNLAVKRNIKKSFWSKISPSLGRQNDTRLRPVILNFQFYDFSRCTCNLILYSMYSEVMRHCYGADTVTTCKLIESKIELASMSIKIQNITRASSLLRKALWQLDNHVFDDESRYSDYLRGRALTLQGICLISMMQEQSAQELYCEALNSFGVHFPTKITKARIKLRSLISNIKKSYTTKEIPKCSKLFSIVTLQLSETLSLMFDLLFKKKLYSLAKLAAFWSLRKALKFTRRFSLVARSFANVLKIIFYTGTVDEFLWVQDAAIQLTNRTIFTERLELDSLTNLVEMYMGIMMCQIARKQIRIAIEIGQISKNLCAKTKLTLESKIVPTLFLLLMNLKRVQDAQRLLERFGTAMKMTNDKNGQIWYHALCMDVLLDTSLTIESYEECDLFHTREIATFDKEGHLEARARFFANLLLWSVRHSFHGIARIWRQHLADCFSLEPCSSINNTFTGLRLVEALTIQLGFAVEDKNLHLFSHLNKELIDLMKVLESALKITKCFTERFELHKLHHQQVMKFEVKRMKKLDNLLGLSIENQNFYSLDLIQHTKRSWNHLMSSEQENFWIDHSTNERSLSLKKAFYFDRVFPYSLPIPMSGNL